MTLERRTAETTSTTAASPEPIRINVAVLTGLTLTAVAVVAAAVWVVLSRTDAPADVWRGFRAATLVSAVAAVASVVPLAIGGRRGLMGVVAGFFASSFVRVIVALGGGLLAVKAMHYPPVATLLFVAGYYLAVLAVESAFVGRVLWNRPA